MNKITQKELKEALNYSPENGIFTWLYSPSNFIKKGSQSGSPDKDGYILIQINKITYKSHRLAWLYVTGRWPAYEIDHINRIRSDNKFCNLREATRSQNKTNTAKYSNNNSGYKGVSWDKNAKKWKSQISINGRTRYLGIFDDKNEAHKSYCIAAKEHHKEFANAS